MCEEESLQIYWDCVESVLAVSCSKSTSLRLLSNANSFSRLIFLKSAALR